VFFADTRTSRIDRIAINARERANEDFLGLYNAFVKWKGCTHPMSRRRYRNYCAVSDVFVAYLDGEPLRHAFERRARKKQASLARMSRP